MTLRIWHAYSCNNSSSYRLVARFQDAAAATAAGIELRGLLAQYGAEDHRGGRHAGFEGLARQYGFTDWEDDGWGGSRDGPHVIVDEDALIVHHGYCTGLGPGFPAFLRERGATVGDESWDDLHVSLLFRIPPNFDELDAVCALTTADDEVKGFQAPWAENKARGRVAHFRDAGSAGLYFPTDPRDLVHLRAWLGERGIEQPVIALDHVSDRELFLAIAAARCTACHGPLDYLDPRLHDIETPQLVCTPCGGLYDLATFQRPA